MKYIIEIDCDEPTTMYMVIAKIREFLDKHKEIQYAIEKRSD